MKKFFLIAILILAAFLRLWHLGSVPPSASMDEASIGYNAYSVVKTGVDEYGTFPLISQRAYDDWRRSTYLLLVVPFVAFLNLHVVSVRLPAAILSVITIWATYRMVYALFFKKTEHAYLFSFLTAFLLAISPWHIYISRLGHESNAYLSFFVLGALFFLEGIQNKRKLLFSMFFFTLSLVSYYAGQIIVPLFVFGLLVIYRKVILSLVLADKKSLFLVCVSLLILIPVFWSVFSPRALIRFKGTSTFNPEAHGKEFAERVVRRNTAVENRDYIGAIFYDRRLFPVKVFIEGYLSHYQFRWLFANSGNESFKVPHMGLLYLWEAPFIILGMWAFLKNRNLDARPKKIVFLWFLLAAFPAAVATQAPHAMRSYAFLPTWQIFTAFGLGYLFVALKRIKLFSFLIFVFLIAMSLQSFYKNYFNIFPMEQSRSFLYPLSQAIPYVLTRENAYEKIVFSNSDNVYQSYMMYLYYSRFDPRFYQRLGGTKSGGFAETHEIGKFEFRPILWKQEQPTVRTLYVGNADDFPKGLSTLTTFNSLDGSPAIKIVSFEP